MGHKATMTLEFPVRNQVLSPGPEVREKGLAAPVYNMIDTYIWGWTWAGSESRSYTHDTQTRPWATVGLQQCFSFSLYLWPRGGSLQLKEEGSQPWFTTSSAWFVGANKMWAATADPHSSWPWKMVESDNLPNELKLWAAAYHAARGYKWAQQCRLSLT